MLAFLKELNQTFGITVVMVTHEMNVVNSICQKVAVMEAGKVAERFAVGDRTFVPQSNIGRFLFRDRIGSDRVESQFAVV